MELKKDVNVKMFNVINIITKEELLINVEGNKYAAQHIYNIPYMKVRQHPNCGNGSYCFIYQY